MNTKFTLFEINSLIREKLREDFPGTYWIVAEISELKLNRTGHCYLELIEKDEFTDDIRARAKATIWSYTFRMIKPYFETTTGQPFREGIKVLVEAAIEYHTTYGLSLNIRDIDPTYTMGDLLRRRREIIRRLEEAGVIHMNKELPLPLVPQRIAVISSATAAGYEDFVKQLEHNINHFRFEHRLFEAFMQGTEAIPSILRALDLIFNEEENFDAVAIIRGGGAQADLSCFDNFDLAYAVTQFPLPVITGIGHEKDDTILDLVAHTRQKTPTAVAEFFISGVSRFYERILQLEEDFIHQVNEIVDDRKTQLEDLSRMFIQKTGMYLTQSANKLIRTGHRFRNGIHLQSARNKEKIWKYRFRLAKFTSLSLQKEQNLLERFGRTLKYSGNLRIKDASVSLNQIRNTLPVKTRTRIQLAEKHITQCENTLRLLDPARILKRGFTLSLQDGRFVKSAGEISENIPMETRFHDGNIFSKVIKK